MVNVAAIWLGAVSDLAKQAARGLKLPRLRLRKIQWGGGVFSAFRRGAVPADLLAILVAVAGLSLLPGAAAAQVHSLVGPQSTTAPAPAPGTGSAGATIVAPIPSPSVPPAVPPV